MISLLICVTNQMTKSIYQLSGFRRSTKTSIVSFEVLKNMRLQYMASVLLYLILSNRLQLIFLFIFLIPNYKWNFYIDNIALKSIHRFHHRHQHQQHQKYVFFYIVLLGVSNKRLWWSCFSFNIYNYYFFNFTSTKRGCLKFLRFFHKKCKKYLSFFTFTCTVAKLMKRTSNTFIIIWRISKM